MYSALRRSLRIAAAALAVSASGLAVPGCYDDTDLVNAINGLNERLTDLENQVRADIEALQIIISAMREQVTVASVVPGGNGGYTITFTDGRRVTISDGRDGDTPPVVSIVYEDGGYWWVHVAADGTVTYITDAEGNRIGAGGKDAIAPMVRINPDTQEWEISADGGKTWVSTGVKARGDDGDSFFREIAQDEDYVYLTLADGTVLKLIKSTDLRFEFVATGIQYFEREQARTFEVIMSGVDKYTVSKPDGWRASLAGEGMVITAPDVQNRYAEPAGKVSVVAVAANGISMIAELEVEAGEAPPSVDLGAAGTANCYMVHAPGYYSFDATVQGNGAAGAAVEGVAFEDYLPAMEPKRAGIVWMTSPEMIIDPVCSEGRISFVVPDPATEGNALIAATDMEGKILWSWHIWVTSYDPSADFQLYDNGYSVMDRDLGALSDVPGDAGALGMLYQWGRKDPFVGAAEVYRTKPSGEGSFRRQVYDAGGNVLDPYEAFPPVKASGDGTIGTIAYATAHPATFIAGKNNTDWYDGTGSGYGTRNNYLWGNPHGHLRRDVTDLPWTELTVGSTVYRATDTVYTRIDNVTTAADIFVYSYSATSRYYDAAHPQNNYYTFRRDVVPQYVKGRKTIYDPCPPGWRIPDAAVWAGFNGESEANYNKLPEYYNTRFDSRNMGRTFVINKATGETAWYPCTGSLNYGDGKYGNYDNGRYWTGEANAGGTRMACGEPGETSLPAGYYYRWRLDQDGSGTNANYNYFSSSGLNVKIYYMPGLGTVEGRTMPTASNMRYYGSQDMSGGAARSFAHAVRCIRE